MRIKSLIFDTYPIVFMGGRLHCWASIRNYLAWPAGNDAEKSTFVHSSRWS